MSDTLLVNPEALGDCPLGPTDWYYRNLVPRNPRQLLRFRKRLLQAAYRREHYARELWIICARDLLFYLNAFGWLLEPRMQVVSKLYTQARAWGDQTVVPFLTRQYQNDVLMEMWSRWGTSDMVVEKSREMGASWMILYLIDHSWRFRDNFHAGVTSKDEASVDAPGSTDSLFWKLDFINEQLPGFLSVSPQHRVRILETHMIRNALNGSTIQGFAATTNVATGGRKTAFVFDEMHKWPINAEYGALNSTQYVSPCRVFVSTPSKEKGQSGAFYDLVTSDRPTLHHIKMGWWRDPEKTRGAYRAYGNKIDQLDRNFEYDPDYPYVGDGRLRSPYYDQECSRAISLQDVAAELDMDYGGAAGRMFDPGLLARAKKHSSDPILFANVAYDADGYPVGIKYGEPELKPEAGGPIMLWRKLETRDGKLVIPPSRYIIGCDIAQGGGGEWSSQSAAVCIDAETREQVWMWMDASTNPSQMADLVWVLGHLFCDANNRPALVVPEVNGPGSQFAGRFLQKGYSNAYIRRTGDSSTDRLRDRRGAQFGLFNNDRGTKILEALQDGIRRHGLKIRSDRILRELGRYQRGPDGKASHPSVTRRGENSHGDCAIGLACAWWPIRQQSDTTPDEPPPPPEILPGSAMFRRLQHLKNQAAVANRPYWSPTNG